MTAGARLANSDAEARGQASPTAPWDEPQSLVTGRRPLAPQGDPTAPQGLALGTADRDPALELTYTSREFGEWSGDNQSTGQHGVVARNPSDVNDAGGQEAWDQAHRTIRAPAGAWDAGTAL